MEKIRVLITDDHTLVREGFANMISMEEEIEVVGQASEAKEALEMVEELKPDIVLMDIKMKGMNGLEATRLIKKKYPDIEVIILSMYDEEDYIKRAVEYGATGYVLKDISRDELLRAIKVVSGGGSLIQPALAKKVLKDLTQKSKEGVYTKELSDREIQLIQLLSEGNTNKDIGDQLFISEKTVKSHLRSIFRKLEVSDRTQAVAMAMRKGWVV
ncbi:MAG: response regulator transcription factor [Armatimonadota bacterium]